MTNGIFNVGRRVYYVYTDNLVYSVHYKVFMEITRRERNRETILQEIKTIAWKQIADQGVSALSLRAIARELGMTAPGLYRYYPSRDDL